MRYALLVVSVGALHAASWQPLFDGKTLNGWKQLNGSATYRVENGEVVGTTVEGSPNSFLCTVKNYGDFILEFEVKTDPRLNSGVQIRSHQYPNEAQVRTFNGKEVVQRKQPAGRVHGYQVEVATEQSGASGGIYDEARRGWVANSSKNPVASKAFKDNEWNSYRVEAKGDHITVTVNGIPTADLIDPVDLNGFIALQVHSFKGDSPAEVRWRNIRIQDLGRHSWQPVGSGSSLDGWKKNGGGEWTVADGTITGKGTVSEQKRGFLIWNEEWTDFTVRLDYKPVKGNSGVFFRMGDPDQGQEVNRMGYEVEVDPGRDAGSLQEPGKGARGWILRTGPASAMPFLNADGFNRMVIHAHGGDITVHINDVKTAELKNDPGPKSGRLALQLNPKQELEVHYKNIELLKPAK